MSVVLDSPPAIEPPLLLRDRLLKIYLPQLYLMRFSLILGVVLLGYVPFALFAVPTMFESTLVLTFWGIVWVTLFTIAAAMTAFATARVVVLHGAERFAAPWPTISPRQLRLVVVFSMLLALPIILTSAAISVEDTALSLGGAVGATLLGAALSAVFVSFVTLLYAWIVDVNDELPEFIIPSNTLVSRVHRHDLPRYLAPKKTSPPRRLLGPGYLNTQGRILPGHLFAGCVCAMFVIAYGVLYIAWAPGRGNASPVPALVYLLIVTTLATWLLSAVAFWLDRHRLPTLVPLIAFSLCVGYVSKSDHYFDVHDGGTASVQLPLDTPAAIAKNKSHDLLTVIAVDGGGIQAAAWATEVLTKLQESWSGFHRSTRFISAISGGSVGTMYFLSAIDGQMPPSKDTLRKVRDQAMQGSLNEAGWGLAYPDLWRAFVPVLFDAWRFDKDRGWAMEEAWRRQFDGRIPTLASWRRGVREGWRPAVALNATEVESGQRYAFATFAPPADWNLNTFAGDHPTADIDVTTAARLSATFPWVTPISRSRRDEVAKDRKHFADGGYYDNTGMGIAMRWLDTAIRPDPKGYNGKTVAFIRLRSSPAVKSTDYSERGWLFESIGPITTLLSVRTAGQRERAETELEFLQRLWHAYGIKISAFEFAFERADPPLSWQLSLRQQRDIQQEWQSPCNLRELRRLLELAKGVNDPDDVITWPRQPSERDIRKCAPPPEPNNNAATQ